MATCKAGLLYYNVDTDRFQDLRIKRLKKDMGCDGYAVYEYILNEIYRVRGCILVWDESTAFDVAEYWGLKETKVNEIVRYCCAVGLFNKALLSNGSVLTSPSIQSRYVNMCIKAKRKEIIIPEEYDILPEQSRFILEEYRRIPEVCDKVKKRKGNNKENSLSGGKEKPPFPDYSETTLAECRDELCRNRPWLEQFCMNLHAAGHADITPDTLLEWLDRFFAKLQNEGEEHKSPRDAQSHFARWLNIELEKLKTHERQPNNPADRRRADNKAAKARQLVEECAAIDKGCNVGAYPAELPDL